MGPAPAGTTAALPASVVACRHEVHGICGAGGSGVRSQAPFAVALAGAGCRRCWWGSRRVPRWPPASVGRRAHTRTAW